MEQFAGNVIDYFEDTYMEDVVLVDIAEHRYLIWLFGTYHPNFWKFIDILKREQSLNHVNISQARAGHQLEPQRRRYQDSNRRIKNIVQDYHNRDRL